MLWLALITFFAATVNGGLGYGFSSITVPLGLLFLSSRILNPALVLVEVFMNIYVLYVNRRSMGSAWPRVKLILLGIAPAVLLGASVLNSINPVWLKFWTYLALLPLLFLQVSGYRRPFSMSGLKGVCFGGGVGFLYSVTTISGPPLALVFNNEGLVKEEFRAALGIVRVFESIFTALVYFSLGLISLESLSLLGPIAPSVLIGIPFGAYLIRKMDADIFRRICMSFDVLIVSFGLSRVLQDLHIAQGFSSYSILIFSVLLDGVLLYHFFSRQ